MQSESKTFRIQDAEPFVSFFATRIEVEQDRILFARGFKKPFILLTKLETFVTQVNPDGWGVENLRASHKFIVDNWKMLKCGDYIKLDGALSNSDSVTLEGEKILGCLTCHRMFPKSKFCGHECKEPKDAI